MRPTATTLALAACLLAACSQTATERQSAVPTARGSAGGYGESIETRARHDARGAVNVIGTPFYALFKATGCVATALLAGPSAAVVALSDHPDKARMRRQLDHGLGHNCRGSYVLRG